jgi:glucosamine--fructose-6-phosphate aminotransferase (isomerizing)
VACKTYVASLLALAWLGGVLTGRQRRLQGAAAAAAEYLAGWRGHVREVEEQMRGIDHLFLAGRGASMAAAGSGGLILKEAAHFHAEGLSAAAFRHGPFEMVSERLFLLMFLGDGRTADLNARLAADVVAAGGRAAVVSETAPVGAFRLPAHAEEDRPVLEILPVQMITLGLASLAGLKAGAFSLATKVTSTE